jgi:hypothetical protein
METQITRLNVTKTEKIFTILVVLLPILQLYAFPGSNILIVEVLFLLLCIKMVFPISKQKINDIIYFPLFILMEVAT